MWKCPKCGREFDHENQSHYCGTAPATIDEYIMAQDTAVQAYLFQVRQTIREALPNAEERISWSMPTWWKRHNLIHFAAAKKHIGVYPGPEAVEYFSNELKKRKIPFRKGSIQVPYSDVIPLDLIREIAQWCWSHANLT